MEYTYDATPNKTSTGADFMYVFGILLAVAPILTIPDLEKVSQFQLAMVFLLGVKGFLLSLFGYLRSRQIRKELEMDNPWRPSHIVPRQLTSGGYYASAVVKKTY